MLDATEPLEPTPFGDVQLAQAKRIAGDRMLLSGNIPSNTFSLVERAEVRQRVRRAIREAAAGGGFTLRTTGGNASTNSAKTKDQMLKILDNVKAYIEAGLEFGA